MAAPSPAVTAAALGQLRAVGLHAAPGWASTIGDVGVGGALAAALHTELRLVVDAAAAATGALLPVDVAQRRVCTVPGPLWLQVDEFVDVGPSAAGDGGGTSQLDDDAATPAGPPMAVPPPGARRVLKMAVTDGVRQIAALESRSLPAITPHAAAAGAKLVVRDVECRRGVLLLTPANCRFLGGSVPALVALQQGTSAARRAALAPPPPAHQVQLAPPAGVAARAAPPQLPRAAASRSAAGTSSAHSGVMPPPRESALGEDNSRAHPRVGPTVASHSRGSQLVAATSPAGAVVTTAVIELLDDDDDDDDENEEEKALRGMLRTMGGGSHGASAPSPPCTAGGDSSGSSSSAVLERSTDWRSLPASASLRVGAPVSTHDDDGDSDGLDVAMHNAAAVCGAADDDARVVSAACAVGPQSQPLHTVTSLAATPRPARGRLGTVTVAGTLSDFEDDAPLDFSVATASLMSLAVRCTLVGAGDEAWGAGGAAAAGALVVLLPSRWVEGRLGLGTAASVYARLKGADTPKEDRRQFKRELAAALNDRLLGTAGVFTLDLGAAATAGAADGGGGGGGGVDAVLVAWAPP